MKEIFKKLIKEFQEISLPQIIDRDYTIGESEEITTLIGLRRIGKTYLLFQKIKELQKKGVSIKEMILINFEDERIIGLKTEDLDKLLEAYYEMHPENINKKIYLFFDEIHAAPNWNYFLKRLYEKKQYMIFVTGSSSKLLSTEIATELRGRTVTKNIYPLSFKEFLKFKSFMAEKNIEFSKKRFELKKLFSEFLEYGGYPQVAKCQNTMEKESLLKSYLELIIYKDIVERHKIRNTFLLKSLIKYFTTNISKRISINGFYDSVKKESSISKDAVSEYFSYLEDIGFFFVLNKFSYSLKRQMENNKKIYVADNGFKAIYGFNTSEDNGRLLENLVFIELKRIGKEAYCYFEKNECDFIIKNKTKVTEAIQVCWSMGGEAREREINGLIDAMDEFKLKEGLILTHDEEEEIKIESKKITVMPVWKWLLEESSNQ